MQMKQRNLRLFSVIVIMLLAVLFAGMLGRIDADAADGSITLTVPNTTVWSGAQQTVTSSNFIYDSTAVSKAILIDWTCTGGTLSASRTTSVGGVTWTAPSDLRGSTSATYTISITASGKGGSLGLTMVNATASKTVTVKQKVTTMTLKWSTSSSGTYSSASSVTVSPGDKLYLKVDTMGPTNSAGTFYGYTSAVTWKVSSSSALTLSSTTAATPTVTVKDSATVGSTYTVTATSNAGGLAKTLNITVKSSVSNITFLQGSSITMWVGESTVVDTSTNAMSNGNVTFTTSNSSIVRIDDQRSTQINTDEATLYGVARGNATITATAKDGSGTKATLSVTVKQKVTKVLLTQAKDMWVGQTQTILATIIPENASDTTLNWSSSSTSRATVDSTGKVTAKGAGSVTITATAADGKGASGSVTFTVYALPDVYFDDSVLELTCGGSYKFSTYCNYDIERTWTYEDPYGILASKSLSSTSTDPNRYNTITMTTDTSKIGKTATITATVSKTVNGVTKTDSASVTIKLVKVPVTSVSIATPSQTWVWTGQTLQLTASVSPTNASYPTITWSSSDTSVATVSTTGKVTGVAKGTVTITATADGKSATQKIEVRQRVTSLTITGSTNYLWVGDTVQLTATLNPSSGNYNNTVTWSSSHPAYATVSSTGLVTAITTDNAGERTVVITARATNGTTSTSDDATKTHTIYVRQQVTSVTISAPKNYLMVGETMQLTASIAPSYAYNKNVTWTTSNSGVVALVNRSGEIRGAAAGTATITATSVSQTSVKSTITITVYNAVSNVVINPTSLTLFANGSNYANLYAYTSPLTNVLSSQLTWKSNDTSLVSIYQGQNYTSNSNVKITLVPNANGKRGSTTITATANDGSNKSASCTVELVGFKLSASAIEMYAGKSYTLNALKTTSSNTAGAAYSNVTWAVTAGSDKISLNTTSGSSVVITANAAGTATITATAKADNQVSATCTVTVKSFTVTVDKVSLFAPRTGGSGEQATLTAKYNNANLSVDWSIVSGGSYISISNTTNAATTIVTATGTGGSKEVTAVVRATTRGASANGTFDVTFTIKQPVNTVTLNKTSITIYKGTTYSLTATASPTTAYNTGITWSSSNSGIASVGSNSGTTVSVKGVSAGTATITAAAADGRGAKATCTVTVRELSLNQSTITLYIGSSYTLNAYYKVSSQQAQSVTWKIESGSGYINLSTTSGSSTVVSTKGSTSGTAVVSATASADTTATVKCTVVVKALTVTLDKNVIYTNNGITGSANYQAQASAKLDGSAVTVTWSSSNATYASINSSGLITGLSTGGAKSVNVTITATVAGSGASSGGKATATITVRQQVNTITISGTEWCWVDGSSQLTAEIAPTYAYDTSITWSSSNTSIATVSSTGKVSGVSKGTVTITVTANDGMGAVATKSFEVRQQINTITLSGTMWCWVGGTSQLSASISPSGVYDSKINWSSSDTSVATIDATGKVTGKVAGTVTITATANDGYGTKATTQFDVRQQVTGITLSHNSWVYVGETIKITPTIAPSNAYNKSVTWKSNNTAVATVDASGNVKGVSAGTVTITATAADGMGATATTTTITVYRKIDSVVISDNSITLFTNGSTFLNALSAYTDPSTGIRSSNVIWLSNDTSLVTIQEGQNKETASNAKITLVPNANGKLGVTQIVVKAADSPSVTNKCTVNVVGFKLSANSATLFVGGSYTLNALKTTSSNTAGTAYDSVKWEITSGSDKISLDKTTGSSIVITAKATGTATIKATATADNTVSASCTLTLKDYVVSADKLDVFAPRTGANNPETTTLTVSYDSSLTNVVVNWSVVSGANYASLSKTSNSPTTVFTPKATGAKTSVVKVRATVTINGYSTSYKDIEITVKQPIDTITFSKNTITMFTNTSYNFTSTSMSPSYAYNTRWSWNSPTNLSITEISGGGSHTVKIQSNGNPVNGAVLTATAADGRGAMASATVNVRKLFLNTSNVTLYLGSTFTLNSYYTLSTDANKQAQTVTWGIESGSDLIKLSSTSGSSTTISTLGKTGTAVITATATADTSATVKCTVSVKSIDLSLNKSFIYVKESNTNATHYQANAYAKVDGSAVNVSWSSLNTALATIDATTGVITGISTNGAKSATVTLKATIAPSVTTATSANPGGSNTITLEIRQQVTGAAIYNAAGSTKTSLILYEGESLALKAIVTPSYAYNDKVNWVVTGSAIELSATTSASGTDVRVTGKNPGTATIKLVSNDGIVPNVLATCEVRVKGLEIKADKLEIFAPRTGVNNPETTTLSALIDGVSANVNWTIVSGSEYATLSKTTNSATTVLTPKVINTTTATVVVRGTTIDGDANTYKAITITIKQPVDTIVFSKNVINMFTNTTYTFNSPTMTPSAPYNPKWTWNSITNLTITNGDVNGHSVIITSNGNVVNGATLTATAADGRGAMASATVNVRKLFLNTSSLTLYLGSTFTLNSYYTTSTDANKQAQNVTWSIESGADLIHLSAATGSSTTVSTLGKTGTAVISATAKEDTSATVRCTVYVKSIDLSLDDTFIYVKETNTNATHYQTNAYAKVDGSAVNVSWSSLNTALATIDATTGVITGISTNGAKSAVVTLKATIAPSATTATSANPGGSNTITLEIRQQVTGAAIYNAAGSTKTSLIIYEDETCNLKAVAAPSYAYNTKLNWTVLGDAIKLSTTTSSSGELVAVTGVKAGTATIQITSNDGIVTKVLATCDVRVKGLELKASKLEIFAPRTNANNPEISNLTALIDGVEANINWTIVSGADYATLSATNAAKVVLTPKIIPQKTVTVTVRGTTTDGDVNTSKELKFTIKQPVDSITFGKDVITMFTNTSYNFTATSMSPSYAYNLGWTWTPIDGVTIVPDSNNNNHTATLIAGSNPVNGAELIASANDGRGATDKLTLNVRKLFLNTSNVTLYLGSTFELKSYYTLSTDANKQAQDVVWAIESGANLIKISSTSGSATTISTLGETGKAVITATATADTTATVRCTVTVKRIVLSLDDTFIYVKEGSTNAAHYQTQAYAKVDGVDMPVTWTSSNTALATVNANTGLVTGISTNGAKSTTITLTATIAPSETTATSANPGGSNTITLEIRQQVTGATIYNTSNTVKSSLIIYENESYDLKVVAAPSYAYNTKLNWTIVSDGEKIKLSKTTSNSGEIVTVTGVEAGTATIQITANDGIVTKVLAECAIRVRGLQIMADKLEIFAPRLSVNNPELSTLNALVDGEVANINWTIVSGAEHATLSNTLNASSTVLTPKTITPTTVTVVVRGTTIDGDANTYKELTITIKQPVSTITFGQNVINMFTDTVYGFNSLTMAPSNPYNALWIWNIPLPNLTITTGDANGHSLTIQSNSNTVNGAVLTATAADGRGATATAIINVRKLFLNTSNVMLYLGSTFTLNSYYTTTTDDNRQAQNVTWKIESGSDVISISSTNGSATTISTTGKTGKAVISATAKEDTSKTVYCNVTVKSIDLTLDDSFIYVKEANSQAKDYQTTAHANVIGETIVTTWSSLNTNLATIDANTGLITGISTNGAKSAVVTLKATIAPSETTYESANPGGSNTITLEIRQQVTSATIYDTKDVARDEIVMYEGTSFDVKSVSYPNYAYNGKLDWTIEGDTIELTKTTTNSGEVITINAIKPGRATIKITSNDGIVTRVLAECKVRVKGIAIEATKMDIFAPRLGVNNPETTKLTSLVDGEQANANWSIVSGAEHISVTNMTNTDVITITPKIISKISETVVIRATTIDGDANTHKDITITIKQPIDAITFGKTVINMFTNTSYSFTSTEFTPSYAYDKLWTWNSPTDLKIVGVSGTNNNDVIITSNGNVVDGATLTATANDGRGATASVTVNVRRLFLNTSNLTLYLGSTFTLNSYYTTSTDANKQAQNVTWKIESGSDVVSISSTNGSATTISTRGKAGTAVIAATAKEDTSKTVRCTVTVKSIDLTLDDSFIYVKEANTQAKDYQTTAHASVIGETIVVTWSSLNTALATIDANTGVVTGISTNGAKSTTVTLKATIAPSETTYESANPGGSNTITLEIRQQVTAATIYDANGTQRTNLTMYVGSKFHLNAVSAPSYAFNEKLVWTLSNNNVSLSKNITNSGEQITVSALVPGETTIKITSYDGIVTRTLAECKVTVKELSLQYLRVVVYLQKQVSMNAYSTIYEKVDQSVTWHLDDASLAKITPTVGNRVTIEGVKAGETILNATTTDADANITLKCELVVKDLKIVTDKSLIYVEHEVTNKDAYTAYVKAYANGELVPCTWTTSDPRVSNINVGNAIASEIEVIGVDNATQTTTIKITATTTDATIEEANMSDYVIIEVRQQAYKITPTQELVILYTGTTYDLSAVLTPDYAYDMTMNWEIISGQNCAEIITKETHVGNNDVITIKANNYGNAVLRVEANDKQGAYVDIQIVVKKLSLAATNITFFKGDQFELVSLVNGNPGSVEWKIDDESIVSMDKTRGSSVILDGKELGTTRIHATSYDGHTNVTVSTTVTVLDMYVESSVKEIFVGEQITFTAYINSVAEAVKWTTSDATIASIDKGQAATTTVTGKSTGEVLITATSIGYTQNGVISVKIRVIQQVEDIEFVSKDDILLYVGGTYPVTIRPIPESTDTSRFLWELDSAIWYARFSATDDPLTMNLTGVRPGKSTFTITADDRYGLSVQGNVTVKELILPRTITLRPGETYTLTAYTDNNVEQSVNWNVNGNNISIDKSSGATIKITANAMGTTTLSATTTDADGNVTIDITVNVIGVELQGEKDILYVGETATLTAFINGVATKCNWSSSDTSVATVSTSGNSAIVKAIAPGKATIVVTDNNGVQIATTTVEVRKKVDTIELSKDKLVIYGNETSTDLIATILPVDASNLGVTISHTDRYLANITTKQEGNLVYFTIKPYRAGTNTITVTANDGQGASASCEIIVKHLLLSSSDLTLYVGGSASLSATASGITTESVSVNWNVGDSSIASISATTGSSINIQAKNVGTTTITATSIDGDVNTTVTCNVTVKQAVNTITLDKNTLTMAANRTETLKILSILPNNASDTSVTWTSSDKSIVTVSGDNREAKLIALKTGEVTITVTANDGQGAKATCKVTVIDADVQNVVLYTNTSFTVTIDPFAGGAVNTTTWTSADTSIVQLSNMTETTALFTAKKAGTTAVTAVCKNNDSMTVLTINVTVKELLIPSELTMYTGTTYTLNSGSDGAKWEINSTIVSLDAQFADNVTLTANRIGTATLTVTTVDADVNVSATCTITVKEHIISADKLTLWVNEKGILNSYSNKVFNSDVKWTTSDNTIVSLDTTVGSAVVVLGKKVGTATVTATTTDGIVNVSKTCTVTVQQQVTSITMKSEITVYVGETVVLTPVLLPSSAVNTNIIWTNYDANIISVSGSKEAKIKGLMPGKTVINANAADGEGAMASCLVTVLQRVESIEIPSAYSMYVGETVTLGYTILPENASNKTVIWDTTNAAVASIDPATGFIKALKAGRTTISCASVDGGAVAYCELTVRSFAQEIILNVHELEMYTNSSDVENCYQLVVTSAYPMNVEDIEFGWISDKPDLISVTQTGMLTVKVDALENGVTYETVTITCRALDGSNVFAKCVITLKQHTTNILLIDYEEFFVIENGVLVGLTPYAYEILETPNITINIPGVIGDERIVEIGDMLFAGCTNIATVIIPESVGKIGENAFAGCTELKNVYVLRNRGEITDVPWGATNAIIHWLDVSVDDSKAIEVVINASNRHLVGFTGATNQNLIIPKYFYDSEGNYYKVIGIGNNAFKDCAGLQSVVIPDSVTFIESNAFSGCTNLQSVKIPESVITIGDFAFYNTKLTDIKLPAALTSIGDGAFGNVTTLTDITIYESIVTIGKNAFGGCDNLATITIFKYYNEVLYAPWGAENATVVWLDPCEEIVITQDNRHLVGYTDSTTVLNIPEIIEDSDGKRYRVIAIGEDAFSGCSQLTKVILPESVTVIRKNAFYQCTSLKEVYLPSDLRSIELYAFSHCYSLESIELPSKLESIWGVFMHCTALKEINIPQSVKELKNSAFAGCTSLERVVMHEGITMIDNYTFYNCHKLVDIEIPSSVTYIGYKAFEGCYALSNIVIPESVTQIDGDAFKDCHAFTEITIPNSVATIGTNAFAGCKNVTKVTIGNGVVAIATNAFENCSAITDIYIDKYEYEMSDAPWGATNATVHWKINKEDAVDLTVTNTNIHMFGFTKATTELVIPAYFWYRDDAGNITWYKVVGIGGDITGRSSALKKIVIPETVTSIASNAFQFNGSLEEIIVDENNVTYATVDGVLYSKDMKTLIKCPSNKQADVFVIPEGVRTIGGHALSLVNGIKKIVIGKYVNTIGSYAFHYCSALTEFEVHPENDYFIAVDGVLYNINLTRLIKYPEKKADLTYDMPDTITTMDSAAVCANTILQNVILSEKLKVVSAQSFESCSSLKSVTFPVSITTIQNNAFVNCKNLTTISLGKNISEIHSLAFQNCTNIKTIYIDLLENSLAGAPWGATSATVHWREVEELTLNTEHLSWIGYRSDATTLEIPKFVQNPTTGAYYKVVGLAANLFKNSLNLTSVILPDSLKTIGNYAFNKCTSLTSINLPDGLTTIGSYAFSGATALKTITIPASVTSIGSYAFHDCQGLTEIIVNANNKSFESVDGVLYNKGMTKLIHYPEKKSTSVFTVPSTVKTIESYAFWHNDYITKVVVPASVTTIGSCAFREIYTLSAIEVAAENTAYTSVEGVLYNKAVTTLIRYPSGKASNNWIIPNTVKTIESYAVAYASKLTEATIPDSVTTIGNYAFHSGTALKKVTIGNGVSSIPTKTFNSCSKLVDIYIDKDRDTVADSPWGATNATVHWANGTLLKITSSNISMIYDGTATELVIPAQFTDPKTGEVYIITEIASSAFTSAKMTSLVIEEGITTIGSNAFNDCNSMLTVTIPASVTSIGDSAFQSSDKLTEIIVHPDNPNYCSVDGVLYTKDMKKLIQYPIYNSAITFTIPTTVTTIAPNAFRQCGKLRTIVLNEYIQTIGSGAFSAMSNIAAFEMPIENEWYCTVDGVLYDGTATTLIQYPLSKADAEFVIPSGVKTISTQAFYSCKYITKVTIPASVTSIGGTAFQACSKMTEIIVDENNKQYCAIDGILYTKDMTQLLCYPAGKKDTTYMLPATVTKLVNNTFQNVKSLTTITVEEGSTAFCSVDGVLYSKDMKTLAYYPAGRTDTSFVVPEGITTIRSTAFHGQAHLTSITLPSTLTSISNSEFNSASKLTLITVKKAAGSLANAPWGATKATVVWEP